MLIGREEELGRLLAAVHRRQPIAVVGAPGIGKTSLARAAGAAVGGHAETSGLATLSTVPFLLFRRLLGGLALESPDAAAAEVLRSAPNLLLLDDLHWADQASLETADRLVGRLPLVATVRAGDPATHRILTFLRRAGFEQLDLTGLDEHDARALAVEANPALGPDELDALVRQAEGSPLLLTEMGRDGTPSPTLTSALLVRLAKLPPAARESMARLSVLGRPAAAELLGPGVDALVDTGLAHVTGALVAVHHRLLAEVVLDDLGAEADRVRRELVPCLDPEEASLLLARMGDRAGARAAALTAADEATNRRVRAEALAVAVDNAPPGDLDAENRFEAADLLIEFGRSERAVELCTIDPDRYPEVSAFDRGRANGLAAAAWWLLGRPERFTELMELAITDLRGTRTEAEVRALAASTLYDTRVGLDGRSVAERAHEAVALAEELGVQQGYARSRLASVLLTSGSPGWAELYRDVIRQAEDDGDDALAEGTATSLILAQWVAGDAHAGRAVAAERVARGPRGDHNQQWLVQASHLALLDVLLGAHPAETVDRWRPVLHEEPLFRTRPFLEASVVLALADLGRHAEAAELAADGPRRAGSDPQWQAVAGWAAAEAGWLAGRHEEVTETVEAVIALGVGDYPPAAMARLVGAQVAVAAGRPPPGAEPVALLPSWRAVPVEWRALVARHEERWDQAITGFDEAAHLYRDHDVRAQARCLWAAADTSRLAGLDAGARLHQAETFAQDRGYVALLTRIHRSLRSAGVSRATPSRAGIGGLTAREVEVLDHVARGATSARIAGELGLSPATVDDLARSAVRRLEVTNRRAAVARLRQLRQELQPET